MKKAFLALLLTLCLLCLSGCSQITDGLLSLVADKVESSGADALARQFIDGLLANDVEKSHDVFVDEVELAQVLQVFPTMQAALPDVDSYTLTPTSWNSQTTNGVTQITCAFLLEMGDQTFVVQTLQISTMEGLYNIHIAPYTQEAATESTVQKNPFVSVVFTIISVLTVVFVIWALVDCGRHKIHRKWVWVLVILLGNMLLTFLLSANHFRFHMNLGLSLNSTSLNLYDDGFQLRLLVPVGSILYFIRRKHLLVLPANGFAEAFQTESEVSDPESP